MKRMETLTWLEVKQYVEKKPAIILPVGSIEQHGPILPIETDLRIAEETAKRVAEKLDLLIAPPITYASSLEHSRFPGTITVNPKTLIDTVTEIGKSLKNSGFTHLFIINGHAGNSGALDTAARILKKEENLETYVFNLQEMLAGIAKDMNILGNLREHAGVVEVSIMKFLKETKEETQPVETKLKKIPKSYNMPGVTYGWMVDEYSEAGVVVGELSKASEETGRLLLDKVTAIICDIILDVVRVGNSST